MINFSEEQISCMCRVMLKEKKFNKLNELFKFVDETNNKVSAECGKINFCSNNVNDVCKNKLVGINDCNNNIDNNNVNILNELQINSIKRFKNVHCEIITIARISVYVNLAEFDKAYELISNHIFDKKNHKELQSIWDEAHYKQYQAKLGWL